MPPKSVGRIGLYPGTFDPVTLGHLDIIHRAAKLFDRLIVGVAADTGKDSLFSLDQRVRMAKRDIGKLKNVEVAPFHGLLVQFAGEQGASAIVRGLRAVSDFEYEIQMAAMNYRMKPEIETVFLTATEGTQFIAARFVREIAQLGGNVGPFVTRATVADLKKAFKRRAAGPGPA